MTFNKKNSHIIFSSILTIWFTSVAVGFFIFPQDYLFFILSNIIFIVLFFSTFFIWKSFQNDFLKRNKSLEGSVVDLLLNSSLPMVITDEHFDIIDYNIGFKNIFGLPTIESQREKHLFQAIELVPDKNTDFSFTLNKENLSWTDIGIAKIKGGNRINLEIETTYSASSNSYILFLRNITAFKSIEHQLKEQIYNDHLTKLPNRKAFLRDFEIFKTEYTKLDNKSFNSHLAIIDLDKFHSVNATEGLEAGNLVLFDFSTLVKNQVKDLNVDIYHLGGDEFILFFKNWNVIDVESFLDELINTFDHNHRINDTGYHLSASIGIVHYPDHGKSVDTLFKNADVAMGFSKKIIGNNYHFFNKSMADLIDIRNTLLTAIKRSLEKNDDFYLVYQPKINIKEGTFSGVEVLLRWKYNNHNVSPAKFIPIAEESGLATAIFKFVIENSIKELQYLIGRQIPSFSINVSAAQISNPSDIKILTSLLQKYQSYAKHIILEITETCIMENFDLAIGCLNDIKKMGFRISIDDFGTGYSSLNTMKLLPVEELKIDRSFIMNIPNEKDESIVKAIIQMAKSFNFKVVAEGIEDAEQLEFLESTDCDIIQGFYFSKPLDITRLKRFSSETF